MSRTQTQPRTRRSRVPALCYHKGSDQDYVRLNGWMHYLGKHDDPMNRQRYGTLIAEWEANGRQLPVPPDEITITELVVRAIGLIDLPWSMNLIYGKEAERWRTGWTCVNGWWRR